MYCSVMSGGIRGIDGFAVSVETDVSSGMPGFDIVGYVGGEVKEAKDRVRTALRNTGHMLPVARITVNLSPGDVKKSGTGFDLPIAISILACMEEIPGKALEGVFVAGELSLSGEVCPTKGILPMILMAKRCGIRKFIIPAANSAEGAVVEGIKVYPVSSLAEVIGFLSGSCSISPAPNHLRPSLCAVHEYEHDFAMIRGQDTARRGAEIAAAGLHNMLMIGPPGAGKTLIAKCIPSILPPLSKEECLEVSAIYSIKGALSSDSPLIVRRPFVAAHSSSTDISLVGGGAVPRPGAVSLAHKGVLFLDEIPEFSRRSLEALRQPLEDGKVCITRNRDICVFPSDFMLIAAANPCPCGHYPDLNKCTCDDTKRSRYLSKISGPFLDRMDLCIQANKVTCADLQGNELPESSKTIRERVIAAHDIQRRRFKGSGIQFNSQMGNRDIEKFCTLGKLETVLMSELALKQEMSARTYYRMLKVARTISDLAGREHISEEAILEAVRLKSRVLL